MAGGDQVVEAIDGDLVARAAEAWIGTPFQHQGSVRGVGADCLGLLRGVWQEILGETLDVPAYSVDWMVDGNRSALFEGLARHLSFSVKPVEPGCVLALKIGRSTQVCHVGVVDHSTKSFIHAYSGRGVIRSPLTPAWRRRIIAQFRFPARRH